MLAPQHPEWQAQQPFKAVLERTIVDMKKDWKVMYPFQQ